MMFLRPPTSFRLLVSIIFIACFCGFISCYNLDSPSIRVSDENAHIRATQSILEGAEFWRPLFNSKYYINKPPFKIALSAVPVTLLGQSNENFRLIDVCCGLGTALLLVVLLRSFTSSWYPGLLTSLLLYTSDSFVFNHGIRHGVQDSMLVFLTTAFLTIFSFHLRGSIRMLPAAVLCGVCAGLAVLTKSLGGLIGPLIGLCYLLVSPYRNQLTTQLWKPLLITTVVLLILSLSYYVPLFLYTPGAFDSIVGEQLGSRMTSDMGYGSSVLFYIERIVFDRAIIAPELLIPALLLLLAVWKKQDGALLFCVWTLVPIILYSLFSTRYTWYINPAIPGAAAAVALSCTYLVRQWQAQQSLKVSLLALVVGSSISVQSIPIVNRVLYPDSRLPIDQLTEYVQSFDSDSTIILWARAHTMEFALHELPYLSMLKPYLRKSGSIKGVRTRIRNNTPSMVLATLKDATRIVLEKPPLSYALLPPLYNRESWAVLLNYTERAPYPLFRGFSRDLLEEFRSHEGIHPIGTRDLPLTLHLHGDAFSHTFQIHLELTLLCKNGNGNTPVQLTFNSTPLDGTWTEKDSTHKGVYILAEEYWTPEDTAIQILSKDCDTFEVITFTAEPQLP